MLNQKYMHIVSFFHSSVTFKKYFYKITWRVNSCILVSFYWKTINLLSCRKLSFKTYEERKIAAEKICKESEQMGALFHKYTNKVSSTDLMLKLSGCVCSFLHFNMTWHHKILLHFEMKNQRRSKIVKQWQWSIVLFCDGTHF